MVKAKVASGRTTSASEVVREALRLIDHQDKLRDLQLQELRRAIQEGLDSGEPVAWNPEAIKAGYLTCAGDRSHAQRQHSGWGS